MPGLDYHLEATSPAVTNPGADGSQRGCYGGAYPMNNLIDVDTSTGNMLPGNGTDIVFDLGSSYTVTHVRLYSALAHQWDVYVGSCSDPGNCICTWTLAFDDWSVGGAGQWYEGDITDTAGQYIKLVRVSVGGLTEDAILEFSYKESGNTYWRTPSIPVAACNDING